MGLHNLKRWKVQIPSGGEVHFFTCARPGRETGAWESVSDSLVSSWVEGLPESVTAIISLLGRKPPDYRKPNHPGLSEYWFYTFCGGLDSPEERAGKPAFQAWLDTWHGDRQIQVFEHPTFDYERVPSETLAAVAADFYDLVGAGQTVVIMDSGGDTRTGQVCTHLDATRMRA